MVAHGLFSLWQLLPPSVPDLATYSVAAFAADNHPRQSATASVPALRTEMTIGCHYRPFRAPVAQGRGWWDLVPSALIDVRHSDHHSFAAVRLLPTHEIFETLKPLTFNLIAGLLAWGYVMDVRLGFVRLRTTALLWLGFAFLAFCVFSHAVKASPSIGVAIPTLGASLLVFLLISLGLTTFRAIEATAAVLLAITLVIASIGVDQALAPLSCMKYSPFTKSSASDGRPCTDSAEPEQCRLGGAPDSGTSVNIPAYSTRTRFKDEFVIAASFKIPTSSPGRSVWGRPWPSRSTAASAPRSDS